jgi:Mrp family chromosome partitioning ATPase
MFDGTEHHARLITFYSDAVDHSRSTALAAVAWSLAAMGQRVLAIDWNLEGPGLHRMFQGHLHDLRWKDRTG